MPVRIAGWACSLPMLRPLIAGCSTNIRAPAERSGTPTVYPWLHRCGASSRARPCGQSLSCPRLHMGQPTLRTTESPSLRHPLSDRVPVHSRAGSLRKFRGRRLWSCAPERALLREGVEKKKYRQSGALGRSSASSSARPRLRPARTAGVASTIAESPRARRLRRQRRTPGPSASDIASRTRSACPDRPSFAKIWRMCHLTVVTLRPVSAAMAWADLPSTSDAAT